MSKEVSKIVRCVSDLLEGIKELQSMKGNNLLWFRGHAKNTWHLIPGIYRDNSGQPSDSPERENRICQEFRFLAPSRYGRCPSRGDHPAWLFLMQHYGAPTRLLDWTKSPLVALYFACARNNVDDSGGDMWVLEPYMLNHDSAGVPSFFPLTHNDTYDLFKDAFENTNNSNITSPLATQSEQLDLRMLVQDSVFTVHPNSNPLEGERLNDDFLYRFSVPEEYKECIKYELRLLNIRHSTLFPDLQALAEDFNF